VKQYSKNLFVLAALFFTKGFANPHLVGLTLAAFVMMCLLGSSTYILNDLVDRERDRAHPKKRLRPIALGEVSTSTALIISPILLAAGLLLAGWLGVEILQCAGVYLMLQVLYNVRLKRVPIADVFVIAAGFVLRVVVGAAAIHAQVSGWILLCSGALALLIGFGKRRGEFVGQGESRAVTRESLNGYTLQILDALVICSAAGTAMCYGLYGIESRTAKEYPALILTVPVVVFGVLRYMMLTFSSTETAEPESVVFRDPQLLVTLILFVLTAGAALAGLKIDFLN
jgi:4-hydroxybenzoate polyprenyltransferase